MTKTERIEQLEKELALLGQAVDVLLDRVAQLENRHVTFANRQVWPKYSPNVTPIGDWPFGPAVTC